jgi:hypothetical protein
MFMHADTLKAASNSPPERIFLMFIGFSITISGGAFTLREGDLAPKCGEKSADRPIGEKFRP